MISRFIWLISLFAMLTITAEPPAASASGCYFREVAYTLEPAMIRTTPDTGGTFVRLTATGEGLVIINSIQLNESCWLETNEGWLIYDTQVISDTFFFFEAGTGETHTGQPTCLPGEEVIITGPMNIRKSATTESSVVASVQTGDTFTVIEIYLGVEWCWMRIAPGWLADTEWVESTHPVDSVDKSATAPTTIKPSDIDNCCFEDRLCTTEQEWIDGYWAHLNDQCGVLPLVSLSQLPRPRIEGSESFVFAVSETLDLMESTAPAVYRYVVSATSLIVEHGPDYSSACGLAYIGTGKTSLGSCFGLVEVEMPELLYGFASTLAHEACHHHDDDINVETGEYDHEPCFKAGREARDAVSA